MLILSLCLCISIFLINATNKLIVCSCFFTLSALTTNAITELYNKKKAIYALALCTFINAVLVWHKFNLMLLIYFASLFLSLCCSVAILEKFKSQLSFCVRNLVGIITAVSIDLSILIPPHLFIEQFPLQKVINIFSRSLMYKMSYALIIGFVILIVSHILLQISHKKKLSSENM